MTATAPGTGTTAGCAPIDVTAERARTPLAPDAFRTTHFLNSAGAALSSSATLDAVQAHLLLEAQLGGYEAAAVAMPRMEGVYALSAQLIGAAPADIALTESASVGWQRLVDSMRLGRGDRVLASRSTYVNSALQLLELERAGLIVEVLPNDPFGRVDLDELALAMRRPASLLAVAHVPTSAGIVEPVAEIGRLARRVGVPYLLDATQSAGQLPVDVSAIGCDALVLTGRKFLRAPRGTGLLYVSPELCARLRPSAPDVRGSRWSGEHSFEILSLARRFESFEASHALRLGFGVAVAETLALGVERIGAHVISLARLLRQRLREDVPEIRIADLGEAPSGIVTFIRQDEDAAETLERARAAGCHVVTVPDHHGIWDLAPRGLDAVVRASFHVYNDVRDVEALVAAVAARPRASVGRSAPASVVVSPGVPASVPVAGFQSADDLDSADTIVIGAGVHGRSVAWQLARRGASVIMLEQFRVDHLQGSSHGATRMIRRAYPAAVWDGLTDRAYASWAELEAEAGVQLMSVTGGLYAHPHDERGLRGPGCEEIDLRHARELAPALVLGDEFSIVYDPAAGAIDAAGALDALMRLGLGAGVRCHDSSPVLAISDDDHGVTVTVPSRTLRAASVVVAAGAWVGALLPEYEDKLEVIRIVNLHLSSADPGAVRSPALPVFAIQTPDAGLLYGIPGIWGRGLKVGLDDGPVDDRSQLPLPVTAEETEALRDQVRRYLPAGDGPAETAVSCRYTRSANRRFAVGSVPGRPRVFVVSACSGHGFKFAPTIGAAVAEMVDGIARPDLEFIAADALPRLNTAHVAGQTAG